MFEKLIAALRDGSTQGDDKDEYLEQLRQAKLARATDSLNKLKPLEANEPDTLEDSDTNIGDVLSDLLNEGFTRSPASHPSDEDRMKILEMLNKRGS
jgi:hypothetical protein